MPNFEPRGNANWGRDKNLFSDRILARRAEDQRFPGQTAREDTEAELVREEVRDKTPDFSRISKMLVVAGGVAAVGSMVGRRRLIGMMDWVGERGYRAEQRVFEPVRSLVDDAVLGQTGTARSVARRFMGASGGIPSRLSPDLANELEQVYSKYEANGNDSIRWLHGRNQTGVDLHADYLARRFHGRTAPEGLAHLTVGDVFASADIRARFSAQNISVLDRARRHGVISDDFSLSSSNTFGLFKNQEGRVLDTQAFSPLRIFDGMHRALRKFQVPFTDMRPADLVFGVVRPFIEEGRHLTIGGNQRMPNGVMTGRGLNFSLGDRVFSQVQGLNRYEEVARGVKTYDVSREGSHWLGRAVAIKQGRIANNMNNGLVDRMVSRDTNPVRYFWQQVQMATGVGPEFNTNRSAAGMVFDAFERDAIERGQRPGAFVANRWVPRRSTLTKVAETRARAAFNRGHVVGNYRNVDEYLEEAVRAPAEIPLAERIKSRLFDTSRTGSYYSQVPRAGFPGTKVGEVHNARVPMQGYTPVGGNTPRTVGAGGIIASDVPASGVVDSPGFMNGFNLFMHHATERLNQLIGTTTGFGVRPNGGDYGWIGTLGKIYGGAHVAKMGLEYLKYTDYLAGQALDLVPGLDNTTPSEYAVKGYAGAMVMRQKLREKIGIQQSASYLEGLMPGSMSLPGMVGIRTLGPIAAGALARGRAGALTGGLVSLAVGGLDPDMTSEDLADIYSGKKKEAVMKNRGWMMGLQPYSGDEIDYYRPNWVARYTSNFRYTDTQYGSKAEYFAHESSALTPHNLLGVLKLATPDHYTEKHYYNRPYPYSTSGERMHEGEELIPTPSQSSYQAQALGYEPTAGGYTTGVSPTSASGMMRRGIDQVTQLGGIYKFMTQQIPFYDDVFGEGKGEQMYAAQAGTITSGSREYYDESVGGLLGMTELLRRFMSPDYGKQGINLIPNTMPDWLPGVRSQFANDKDYFTDFTLGDPYARVPMGEARLPGPGYEALAELHSKTPGVYDAFDRYKILADVAPYSDAFKNYRTIVQSWALSGALDKSSMEELQQTEGQVRDIVDGPEFTPRRFSGIPSGTPEQLAEVNKYSAPERAIGAAWETLTHDLIPGIGRSVPVLGTMLDRKLLGQRSAYESYMEDQVYGTDFHDWRKPWDTMVRPHITNLAASGPVTAFTGGVGLGLAFGATPLGAAVGAVGGATLGAISTARTLSTGEIRGGWVPGAFQERNKLENYFDSLEYERAGVNLQMAEGLGRKDLTNQFKYEQGRTAVGMNYEADDVAFMNAAKFRLGSPMRKYAWQFLQAPAQSRQQIMAVAPDMARPILSSAWNRQGDTRFKRRPQASADDRSQETIAAYGMPSRDWGGWSPDVPMSAIKIRTLDSQFNEAYDMHKYNLWEADRRTSNRSYPGLTSAF